MSDLFEMTRKKVASSLLSQLFSNNFKETLLWRLVDDWLSPVHDFISSEPEQLLARLILGLPIARDTGHLRQQSVVAGGTGMSRCTEDGIT